MASVLFAVQNLLVLIFISSFEIAETVSEEQSPSKPLPYHNLIPRFKMPRGNLLRYKIPQWEVLYFLKYGIVPFIFYDPNFNRTNFITQVHKFKMYFDDGRPNRTQFILKDEEAFREFLRKHGYPNYNQLPANALSRNNKLAEEINGLLRSTSTGNSAERQKGIFGQEDDMGNLDELIEMMKQAPPPAVASVEKEELLTAVKRGNPIEYERGRQYFWNAFINRYPMLFYPKSYVGTDGFLVDHDPSWMPRRSALSTRASGASGSDLQRHTKSFRLDLRNDNSETEGAGDDATRAGGGGEIRRGGKNFQTQGW